ncbi:MAG TPA: DUF86 domain-containing protein [Nitrospirae bacterium]|nr:DUF86 domain-containing protein [Nitrospirota bacterium]
MSRNITLYIKDILQNMSDAEDFISGISYEQFTNDQKTLNAVLRSIEVIGEAAKNIPDNIRNLCQDIPGVNFGDRVEPLLPQPEAGAAQTPQCRYQRSASYTVSCLWP